MYWFIKYQESVEKVRKQAEKEGTALGPNDNIILGKNNLPTGEVLMYSKICL